MRLYLSAFDLGNEPERLVAMSPRGSRASIVLNALDNFPEERKYWYACQKRALENLGFLTEELDLRDFFHAADRLELMLQDKALIWISGGNAFLLRRAMRQSGFDLLTRTLLSSNGIVYAGFSAAVCCAAPTLRGIEFVDDPSEVPDRYMNEPLWDGLGLIDYNVAVHYGTEGPQGKAIQRSIACWRSSRMPYITLRDGQALVVDGDKADVVG